MEFSVQTQTHFIPSVDMVGRHYPFSIVKEVSQSPVQMWANAEWDTQLEDWILDTVKP